MPKHPDSLATGKPPTTHDPGGKRRLKLPDGILSAATFSEDMRYRHTLVRAWGRATPDRGNYALWIGMNPSTADDALDDGTVRAEWTYTRQILKLDRYIKVNVMDYRQTYPEELLRPGIVPRSAQNLSVIVRLAKCAQQVILTIGNLPPVLQPYAAETIAALEAAGIDLWCINVNKDGFSPRHSGRGQLTLGKTLQSYPAGAYPHAT